LSLGLVQELFFLAFLASSEAEEAAAALLLTMLDLASFFLDDTLAGLEDCFFLVGDLAAARDDGVCWRAPPPASPAAAFSRIMAFLDVERRRLGAALAIFPSSLLTALGLSAFDILAFFFAGDEVGGDSSRTAPAAISSSTAVGDGRCGEDLALAEMAAFFLVDEDLALDWTFPPLALPTFTMVLYLMQYKDYTYVAVTVSWLDLGAIIDLGQVKFSRKITIVQQHVRHNDDTQLI